MKSALQIEVVAQHVKYQYVEMDMSISQLPPEVVYSVGGIDIDTLNLFLVTRILCGNIHPFWRRIIVTK